MAVRRTQAGEFSLVVPSGGGVRSGIQVIRNPDFTAGNISIPAALDGTPTLTYEVTHNGTTFTALRTSAGAALAVPTITTNPGVGNHMPLPAELFNYVAFRLLLSVAQTTGVRTFTVRLY